jgi:hypothetical protein
MLILIVKDSATQVPREVKDLEEAQAFADQGHHVLKCSHRTARRCRSTTR